MALVRDGAGVSKIQGMVDDKVLFSVVSSLRVRNMDYFFPAPCASSSFCTRLAICMLWSRFALRTVVVRGWRRRARVAVRVDARGEY
jgi:hypothetical protein